MADKPDRDSKTEQATDKKLRDEIERGNVPVSREATIFTFMVALLLILAFFLKDGAFKTALALAGLLDHASGVRLRNGDDFSMLCQSVLGVVTPLLLPIFLILGGAGLAASIAQNAPRIVFQRLQPDLSRISPIEGWHRIFGRSGQVEFLKSFAKFLAVAVVIFALLQMDRGIFTGAMFVEPEAIPGLIMGIAVRFIAGIAIATLLLVTGDVVWSRIHWRQELQMTRQEVKEELKQLEGDPLMKSRMRSLALDRRRRSMIAAVSRASLVIANPTHYAIAVRYVREEGGAPRVLAKGQDLIALRIRQVAEEHDIPVVEDKALARSMYNSVEVDQMIPPEFYRAVAELIHFLHKHEPRRGTIELRALPMPVDSCDDHSTIRAKAIADGIKEVAAELRLINVADFISFIHCEQFGNIKDIVNSSMELYFKHGTLSYGCAADYEIEWDRTAGNRHRYGLSSSRSRGLLQSLALRPSCRRHDKIDQFCRAVAQSGGRHIAARRGNRRCQTGGAGVLKLRLSQKRATHGVLTSGGRDTLKLFGRYQGALRCCMRASARDIKYMRRKYIAGALSQQSLRIGQPGARF